MIFAVAYSAIGFSLYFSLGVVADYGLGLTPLLFLGAGFMFVLATLTYAEGGSMFVERGGSSNMARYAFNELVSFIAGWALLIDFIVVVALAAVSAPHYLSPIWDGFGEGTGEVLTAVAIVVGAALVNVLGWWGFRRQRLLVALAIGDIVVQLLLIVVGLAVVFDPAVLTQNLDLGTSPQWADAIYALVIATVAFAGIEAASDLAPDLDWDVPDLRRAVTVGAALLPIVYAGVAAVALMAVPVMMTPDGPESALGGEFIEEPILGVAQELRSRLGFGSDAGRGCGGRAGGAGVGGVDVDAGVVAPRLRAGDEQADPELAGEALAAAYAVRCDCGCDADCGWARDSGRHRGARGHLRLRRDACDRDRPRLDRAAAREAPGGSPPVPDSVGRADQGGEAAGHGAGRLRDHRLGVAERDRLSRRGALGWRRVDGVRLGGLRHLSQGV